MIKLGFAAPLAVVGMIVLAAGTASAQAADGAEGGACYGNGTCNDGLACDQGICVAIADGTEGGACYGNGTCNDGLACDRGVCVAAPRDVPPDNAVGPGAPQSSSGSCFGCAGSIDLSAHVGLLFPGSAYVEIIDASVDTDAGLLLGVGGDYHVASRITVGAFALLATASAADEGFTVFTVGMAIKASFPFERFVVRPGVALGYQRISADGISDDPTSGFDLGALIEGIYPIRDRLSIFGQLSFISQPAGGNDLTDVTFAPILFLSGGVDFLL